MAHNVVPTNSKQLIDKMLIEFMNEYLKDNNNLACHQVFSHHQLRHFRTTHISDSSVTSVCSVPSRDTGRRRMAADDVQPSA